MPKVSPLQSNFGGGEFSPLAQGRVDTDRYKSGMEKCLNYVPVLQGCVTRRPGTYHVAEVKSSSAKTRLIRFEYSITQAYILEFGDQYIRFYKDNGRIESGGSPVEISSPYLTADLFELKFTQSADTLYIVHPSYAPRKLTRSSHTSWTLTTIVFTDGPWGPLGSRFIPLHNPTVRAPHLYRMTSSVTTGTGTLTFTGNANTTVTGAANNGSGLIRLTLGSAVQLFVTGELVRVTGVGGTTEANGSWTVTVIDATHVDLQGSTFTNAFTGAGNIVAGEFYSTDVGRYIRILNSSTSGWAVAKITGYTSATVVAIEITLGDLTGSAAVASTENDWKWDLWSANTGYPSCIAFHEDRLCAGGSTNYPQRFDASCSGDYENFAPSSIAAGTVTDDSALSFTLSSNDVNALRWLASDEKGLLSGSVAREWLISPSSQGEAITPTNVNAKSSTSYGSQDIQPIQVGRSTLFVQKAGRKLRELAYFYDASGFRATDLTQIAEHVTQSGIVELAYQKEPYNLVWAVRTDGVLACMTYDRDLDSLRVAWHRHILGGVSDAAGSDAIVESVAVIPSADLTRDEVWLVVKRYVNGSVKRYIEYMKKFDDETVDQQDCFYVDSGLTLDSPKTITGITKANPAVVTANAHGFSNGDTVIPSEVAGMTEVNGNIYTVANVTANTFELSGVNSSSFTAYISGGEVRKRVSSVSGLSHLEGQSVTIMGDGAKQNNKTVSGGAITLDTPAAVVHVGLGYNSDGKLLRFEAGSADGTALGKKRRTHHVGMLLHRTLGLKLGTDFDDMTEVDFTQYGEILADQAVPMYSGIISESFEADYDFENNICWRQSGPFPGTILAVMPQMHTQDNG